MLPVRKKNRLQRYDYAEEGCYFITVCTHKKEKLFWLDDQPTQTPPMSEAGEEVDQSIRRISKIYPWLTVDIYAVMPNHIHLLLRAKENCGVSISIVVGSLKRQVSKKLHRSIWQKGFYDHVIRGEQDYREIWQYIEANPIRWSEDCFFE